MTDREILELLLKKVGEIDALSHKISEMDSRISNQVSEMDSRISNQINEMDSRIVNMKENMATKDDIRDIKSEVARVERKLDAVYEQVSGLIEFKTITAKKISNLAIDIKILKKAVAE